MSGEFSRGGVRQVSEQQTPESADDIFAALKAEFRNEPEYTGGSWVQLVHQVGAALNRIEDALGSDRYSCPECGAYARAEVLDAHVGAVWTAMSCICEGAEDRITAAVLERDRLHAILVGEGGEA